jgi:glycosyltransferase involved in cell wall biosynthesis
MLRIIYTPEIFSLQRVGGISRYICELIKRVPNQGLSAKTVAGIHFNRHLRRLPVKAGFYIPKLGPLGRYRLKFNSALCRRVAAKTPSVVIHSTYYSEEEFPKSHPFVLTVHDMIDELFPEQLTAVPPGLKRRNCERADRIIAVSNNTKNDLVKIFGISPQKIVVIYHGDSLPTLTRSNTDESRAKDYLLFIGARGHYKNFARLVQAFAASAFLKNRFRLLTFGGSKFSEDERKLIEELKVTDQVRQVAGDDVALAQYYRNAAALIYPSLYEGFGMPILEAIGQGCPVICSDPGGALREVAGNAAAYFDGSDATSMQLVMEQTLGDPKRVAELRDLGTARHQLFSWDKCVQETVNVYREVAR